MARRAFFVGAGLTLSLVGCGPGMTPVAPTATRFMWPTRQTDFLNGSGTPCTGRLTMAVGNTAVCFNAVDDRLRCAGQIGGVSIASSFVDYGIGGVDQILFHRGVSSTGIETQDVCVRTTANQVFCRGSHAPNGTAAWSEWLSGGGPYSAISTDGTGALCALDACGTIHCTDFSFGGATTTGSGNDRFYVALNGSVIANDSATFRMQANMPYCRVEAIGLDCNYSNPNGNLGPFGTAGQVVDGTIHSGPDPDVSSSLASDEIGCWLSSTGAVQCVFGSATASSLGSLKMLAIAGDFDDTTLCGVSNDGALWCRGANVNGKLGTGTTTALAGLTRVVPPLTVFVGCSAPPAPPVPLCPPRP